MNVKKAREATGFTQVKVASEVGISDRYYQEIEAGKSIPNVVTAQRIAKALGKTVEELFPIELA